MGKVKSKFEKKLIAHNLIRLSMLYTNIMLTFALIYHVLDLSGLGPIIDHYASDVHQHNAADRWTRSLYFSAITLFSVGYGDLTPFGWSRALAIVQAMIGYILPAALVVHILYDDSPHSTSSR
jgi:potassium channel LctB